jgi:hypothetical protein
MGQRPCTFVRVVLCSCAVTLGHQAIASRVVGFNHAVDHTRTSPCRLHRGIAMPLPHGSHAVVPKFLSQLNLHEVLT